MCDRFDICDAYLMLEHDYERSGWLQERGRRADGSVKQVTTQLRRLGFRPSPRLTTATLTDEARDIYDAFVERHGLPHE